MHEQQPAGAGVDGVVVGVDLGGTKTAAAVVDAEGSVTSLGTVATPAQNGPAAVLDAVAHLVREVVMTTGNGLRAVGVGAAGVIDAGQGIVVSATDTFPGWPGTDIVGELTERLADLAVDRGRLPVLVENDVDAHAAGEIWRGAAAGARSALLVAVGTGVGGAVVLDGSPLHGAHHLAGEMGHMPVPGAEGLRCTCGRLGHVEAIGAGPAIHRRFLQLGGDPATLDPREVVARADAGDDLAARVIREAAEAVGRAIAAIVTVVDPEVVVVSGGLAGAGKLWWSALEDTVRAEVVDVLADVPVLPATLGGQAAIVGAARRAWTEVEETSITSETTDWEDR